MKRLIRILRVAMQASYFQLTEVERRACKNVLNAALGQDRAADDDNAIVDILLKRTEKVARSSD